LKEISPVELAEKLTSLSRIGRAAVACIGTELRSDDAASLRLCDLIDEALGGIRTVRCLGGLESCFSEIAESHAEVLLVADALLVESSEGGRIFLLSPDELEAEAVLWSHRLPPKLIIDLLRRTSSVKYIEIVGISVADLSIGEELSEPLKKLMRKLEEILKSSRVG